MAATVRPRAYAAVRRHSLLCKATQDFSPLEPLWRACGLVVIPAAKLPVLAYGEACVAESKAKVDEKSAKERKRLLEALL